MESFDRMVKEFAPLVGRIFIATLFVVTAIGFMRNYATTAAFFQQAAIPMASVALPVALLFKFVGSASLVLGYKTKWGALALFVFTFGTIVLAHRAGIGFTNVDPGQQIMFLKNLAIMGGLLFVYAFGPGAYALDNRKKVMGSATAAMN
jgi:putative oxidoreductase